MATPDHQTVMQGSNRRVVAILFKPSTTAAALIRIMLFDYPQILFSICTSSNIQIIDTQYHLLDIDKANDSATHSTSYYTKLTDCFTIDPPPLSSLFFGKRSHMC